MTDDSKTTKKKFKLHPDNDTIVIWEYGSAGCLGKDARENATLIVKALTFYLKHHDDNSETAYHEGKI